MSRGRAIMRWHACLICWAYLAAYSKAQPTQAVARPDIVLIVADDLGYGDLGCYGQQRIHTPCLDQMAAEGLRFRHFYAGSTVCAPSRCALMTGRHTGHAFIRGNGHENLRPDDVTLAEVLQRAGYRTAAIGKWGLGHEDSTGLPTRQGFDTFFGYLDQVHAHNYYPAFLIRDARRVPLRNVVPDMGPAGQGVATEKIEYSHDLFIDKALRFIDGADDRPFFLYLALTIPHANNEAGANGMEVPDLGSYAEETWPPAQQAHAAMISRMDVGVGRVLDRLRSAHRAAPPLVLFTSDNGPHDEGGVDPKFNDSNGPLRGNKRDLTEGGIRVPLIVWSPGRAPAGVVTDQVSANWDLLPTLAASAVAQEFLSPSLDGISLMPTIAGREADQRPHDALYWAFYEGQGGQALRRGSWKAIEQPIGSPVRLYNLVVDEGESHDVATEHPDVVSEFIEGMRASNEPSATWKWASR